MARRYINELAHQESIDQVFVASDKQLRPNRAGSLYLQVALSDRTGSIAARLWNAGEAVYKSFDNGDYLHVVGTAQLYQGAMQIIAAKLHKVDPAEVERHLLTHPAVADCAVVGKQAAAGCFVKAFIVSRSPIEKEQLIGHCQGAMAEFKVPKAVEFVSEIPRSPLGKILRKYLE